MERIIEKRGCGEQWGKLLKPSEAGRVPAVVHKSLNVADSLESLLQYFSSSPPSTLFTSPLQHFKVHVYKTWAAGLPDSAISVFTKKRNQTVGSWLRCCEVHNTHVVWPNNGHRGPALNREGGGGKQEEMRKKKRHSRSNAFKLNSEKFKKLRTKRKMKPNGGLYYCLVSGTTRTGYRSTIFHIPI